MLLAGTGVGFTTSSARVRVNVARNAPAMSGAMETALWNTYVLNAHRPTLAASAATVPALISLTSRESSARGETY